MLGKTKQREKRTKITKIMIDKDKTANPPNIKNILKAKCKYFYDYEQKRTISKIRK